MFACRSLGENGKISYDFYRFKPGSEGKIPSEITQEELERRADGHVSRGTYEPDHDYEALFAE